MYPVMMFHVQEILIKYLKPWIRKLKMSGDVMFFWETPPTIYGIPQFSVRYGIPGIPCTRLGSQNK